MAFATGLLLIDAQASALNNLGSVPGERFDNSVGVKVIRTKEGFYPYVSAQAFRYWLRRTLETSQDIKWVPAPVYREEKVAYTDANPIRWWDDDLFGYMRAPSTRESAKAQREADESKRRDGNRGHSHSGFPFQSEYLGLDRPSHANLGLRSDGSARR